MNDNTNAADQSSEWSTINNNSDGLTPTFIHQTHRCRPGRPQRICDLEKTHDSIAIEDTNTTQPSQHRVDDKCNITSAFDRHLNLGESITTDNAVVAGVAIIDAPSFKSNANSTGSSENSATAATIARAEDDSAEQVEETDRLLDTSDQSGDVASVDVDSGDSFGGRSVYRVRTLSGQPLSIPLNCSPAVLRHGLGTALSNNEGEVIGDADDGDDTMATSASQRPVGKFIEIGKRNSKLCGHWLLFICGCVILFQPSDIKWDASLLIEGVLFRANYLGSTQLMCDGQPTKISRMLQAEEAVSRIKVIWL